MKSWLYLLEKLTFRPTIPLLIAVLQHENLLEDSGDGYDDGMLLFQDIVNADVLDERRASVVLDLCGNIKVPVMDLRDRGITLYYSSHFPGSGRSKGRLCVQDLIERERISDLETMYSRVYENPKFNHHFALSGRRMSRDGTTWARHEDSPEFEDTLAVLQDCDKEFELIAS